MATVALIYFVLGIFCMGIMVLLLCDVTFRPGLLKAARWFGFGGQYVEADPVRRYGIKDSLVNSDPNGRNWEDLVAQTSVPVTPEAMTSNALTPVERRIERELFADPAFGPSAEFHGFGPVDR